MKKTLLALAMTMAATGVQAEYYESGDNTQYNDSDSSSSANMSNYQLNNNNNTRHRVGDVECAAPSVTLDLIGPKGLGNNSTAAVSFNYPLGGRTCQNAQEQRLKMMKYTLHVQTVEQHKKDILFQEKMAQICDKLHHTMNISGDHILAKECAPFEPTHGHPPKGATPLARIAPHG